MSKICSVCGTSNPDEASFCEGCGVELSSLAPAAPAPEGAASDAQPQTQGTSPQSPQPTSSEPVRETPPELSQPDANQSGTSQAGVSASQAPAEASSVEPPSLERSESPFRDAGEGVAGEGAAEDVSETASETAAEAAPSADPIPDAMTDPVPSDPAVPVAKPDTGSAVSAPPAKLFPKRHGALGSEPVALAGERLVVGRFDPSSGPVDIDVSSMAGAEHISRRHAELYQDAGRWQVRDLGSTNGVFLKRAGEASYGPRLQEPAALADGDELAFGNLVFVFRQDGA